MSAASLGAPLCRAAIGALLVPCDMRTCVSGPISDGHFLRPGALSLAGRSITALCECHVWLGGQSSWVSAEQQTETAFKMLAARGMLESFGAPLDHLLCRALSVVHTSDLERPNNLGTPRIRSAHPITPCKLYRFSSVAVRARNGMFRDENAFFPRNPTRVGAIYIAGRDEWIQRCPGLSWGQVHKECSERD